MQREAARGWTLGVAQGVLTYLEGSGETPSGLNHTHMHFRTIDRWGRGRERIREDKTRGASIVSPPQWSRRGGLLRTALVGRGRAWHGSEERTQVPGSMGVSLTWGVTVEHHPIPVRTTIEPCSECFTHTASRTPHCHRLSHMPPATPCHALRGIPTQPSVGVGAVSTCEI